MQQGLCVMLGAGDMMQVWEDVSSEPFAWPRGDSASPPACRASSQPQLSVALKFLQGGFCQQNYEAVTYGITT